MLKSLDGDAEQAQQAVQLEFAKAFKMCDLDVRDGHGAAGSKCSQQELDALKTKSLTWTAYAQNHHLFKTLPDAKLAQVIGTIVKGIRGANNANSQNNQSKDRTDSTDSALNSASSSSKKNGEQSASSASDPKSSSSPGKTGSDSNAGSGSGSKRDESSNAGSRNNSSSSSNGSKASEDDEAVAATLEQLSVMFWYALGPNARD